MDRRASIFISYSHQDETWKDYAVSHLKMAETHGPLRLWDDRKIKPGGDWKKEIEIELEQADVAVLLVSRHSLTSEFILEKEVTAMLRRREAGGLTIFPIVVSACAWKSVDWLAAMNLRPRDGKQLASFSEDERDQIMTAIVEEIMALAPLKPAIDTDDAGDLCGQLLASFHELHSAAQAAAESGNGNPDAEALAESLSFCLDDLSDCHCHPDLLVTLPQYLADRTLDIERDGLERYFEGVAAVAPVLAKLEELTSVTAGHGRQISTQDHRDLVEELLAEIAGVLTRLKSGAGSLDTSQAKIAETELRTLRREVAASTYNAETVSRCRAKLEAIKVKMIERTTLLAETLLARSVWQLPAGTVFRDVPELWCPQMVVIPKGRFLMGSPEDEEGRLNREGPQHEVTFAKAFALARYPMTFPEYDHFCDQTDRAKPQDRFGRDRHPVINVSHDDAEAYCSWLSGVTEATYQLPSEAQWEYACRSGTTTAYSYGDDADTVRMNTTGSDVGRMTNAVDRYQPNAWGLHDMHGNVWEWCGDHWHKDYRDAPTDGASWLDDPPPTGLRVMRGGSWAYGARHARAAYRIHSGPEIRSGDVGFRCARVQASGATSGKRSA